MFKEMYKSCYKMSMYLKIYSQRPDLQNIGITIQIWVDKNAVLNVQKQDVEMLLLVGWKLGLKVW